MSVTRINEFTAIQGKDGELREFLEQVVRGLQATPGCLGCRLLQNEDAAERFVVLEEWDSPQAHRASVQDIKPEDVERVMQLLDGTPRGEYYRAIVG